MSLEYQTIASCLVSYKSWYLVVQFLECKRLLEDKFTFCSSPRNKDCFLIFKKESRFLVFLNWIDFLSKSFHLKWFLSILWRANLFNVVCFQIIPGRTSFRLLLSEGVMCTLDSTQHMAKYDAFLWGKWRFLFTGFTHPRQQIVIYTR